MSPTVQTRSCLGIYVVLRKDRKFSCHMLIHQAREAKGVLALALGAPPKDGATLIRFVNPTVDRALHTADLHTAQNYIGIT